MYPEYMTEPMRKELTDAGLIELKTESEVDGAMKKQGTTLLLVNSVCGCAAGSARPGVISALKNEKVPENKFTVFAGVDTEATNKARSYLTNHQPSSPSIAILKDGNVVYMLERKDIEGNDANVVSNKLSEAFKEHCN
jgi:putative YphP/YqiW family bacilliredoxin